MKNLFLCICALLSASAALCQESNTSTDQSRPTSTPERTHDGVSNSNYVLRRSNTEDTYAKSVIGLRLQADEIAKKNAAVDWSPPGLPTDVIEAKQAAELKKRNEAINEEKKQKRLGEKAYVFGVAADEDALK